MTSNIYQINQIEILVNVLVIGSGGREHAIGWKLGQNNQIDTVFHAPGNGGTKNNISINMDNLEELAKFASENNCFTVVGPEAPLAMGIVDLFNQKHLKIFGPTKHASQLESSKIWAKEFMKRNNIPTATFDVFTDPVKAKEYVNRIKHNVVVKADGLAAGKGVIVCNSIDEAEEAIDMMLVDKKFGNAGDRILIDERIDGLEASYIALADGKKAIPMATSQDHKRIFDNDKGSNTGGMGAYSPTILMRMESDLFQYLVASVEGELEKLPAISWKDKASVCVVLAAKGYPESYQKNDEIFGLEEIFDDTYIFHAGTKRHEEKILTNGGRVLGITALGDTLESAINNAYHLVDKITWSNKYCRTDIGKKGLNFT